MPFGAAGRGGLLLAAAPLAAAIGVFGVIFGAAARTQMDAWLVLAMSLLIFSGSLQFAVLGLIVSGAGPLAIIITALGLNARHVVMGAILRHRLEVGRWRSLIVGWFMIDESFGLALAARRRVAFVLLLSGAIFFVAWQVGTLIGVLGAQAVALSGLATAVFPVLFIGLAALTARSRAAAARAIAAALIVVAGALLVPQVHAYLPILAALLVALPGGRAR